MSYVGMVPDKFQPQPLRLHDSCVVDHPEGIQHEFLHAVGVYHTHSRTDRDKHVTIHWDNIPNEVYEDFCKESSSLNFNTKYEPRSLMHYVWNAGAINDSKPTISLKVICQYNIHLLHMDILTCHTLTLTVGSQYHAQRKTW